MSTCDRFSRFLFGGKVPKMNGTTVDRGTSTPAVVDGAISGIRFLERHTSIVTAAPTSSVLHVLPVRGQTKVFRPTVHALPVDVIDQIGVTEALTHDLTMQVDGSTTFMTGWAIITGNKPTVATNPNPVNRVDQGICSDAAVTSMQRHESDIVVAHREPVPPGESLAARYSQGRFTW